MRPSLSLAVRLCLLCAIAILAVTSAFASVGGALYTTTVNGATVNGNIYTDKANVYISGGPQNKKDPGLVPDGNYYFQVTDPSGSVLLSTDPITCRIVVVTNGRVAGVPTDNAGGFGTPACYHNDGSQDDANGALPVQLCSASGCPSGPPPGNPPNPLSYYDTPNPGGEYKAWITPVGNYSPNGQDNCSQPSSHMSFGFCDSDSKTDNFKVKPPNAATITACKFIDLDNDITYNPANGDFLTAGWQITATGVDGDTGTGVTQTTDQDGCTTWTFTFPSGVTTDTVTLTEIQQTGFSQVAPANGTCTLTGTTVNGSDTCSVSNGVITATISPNDIVVAPFFGNAPGAALVGLTISKTATGGNLFNWNITKTAGTLQQDSTNGTSTFSYTVTVSHDGGTGWVVGGSISVTNPNTTGGTDGSGAIDGVTLTDNIGNGGQCSVNGGPVNNDGSGTYSAGTIAGGATISVPYTCTFPTNPGSGTNIATVTWDPTYAGGGPVSIPQTFDLTSADTSVTVTDSLAGNLGTVSINPDNSTSCSTAASGFAANGSNLACSVSDTSTAFTYSLQFTNDPAGTCTQHNNTASFATNANPNTLVNSNPVTVTQCVGEDVTVSKTATAGFTAGLAKSVNQTKVEQSGGNITFNYTVNLTSPTFSVTGYITVTNPNDWESVTVNVGDMIDHAGTCTVTGGTGITIPASGSSGQLAYSCSYTSNPTLASGTNTASVTETGTTDTGAGDPNVGKPGIVPGTPKPGTAGYSFPSLTVTDNVQDSANPGGCVATLGTVTVLTNGTTVSATPGCGVANLSTPSWGVFKYSITDANANPGTCTSYNNTAQITGGASSNQVTVTVCNTNTGALTMGFWKNTNGQKIVSNSGPKTGTCAITPWLRGFNPFGDLSPTATCTQVASYVNTVIGAATCGGSTCNPMLKAQMLATALDVYFSTPGLGGNQIGGYNGLGNKTPALGTVAIDLSHVCSMLDGGGGSSCTGAFEDARPEFGIASTCQGATVGTMLVYSDYPSAVNGSPVSNSGGSNWYKQSKTPQVIAKDAFDSTNNSVANIATGNVCSSTF